ncbi:exodeoxyribonuclease 7 large subunit [Pullulanibacillus camelliae]|uniref:Exodeoxyribonuclease 7 large subunit n=1 Tax=Pullulanibacillus camelliae TaxID=1707096 RepID=A0A8J2YJI9_9BACL|nr:exodeoxyribonuclease VII large subunit [Pullulanibacillus camelliae]GGE46525.1 exodeoxyribonuclease 7 large subunit [Pullulanibacillus camelliae]
MAERRYITVTALTRYIKGLFEKDRHLQDVWLRAEISNFKRHSRGHMYLTLKDKQTRISAVMFAADNRRLTFVPEDGMKVLVRGEISLYEPYGQYQIYIKEMQPDGVGHLHLAFEQLKKKLAQEGLFDQELKKSLPAYPRNIGVVTSPTGAAIRDIFTTIKRRFPAAMITVFPVLVQGEYAASSIARAIERANESQEVDVLIIGRGGGSIEELWAFNEEIVARSIHASLLPIVSAVGHETDFTIADFVADIRAATPTAAAELVVPHIMELQERIQERYHRLQTVMKKRLEKDREHLTTLQNAYAFKYPGQLIRQKEQELDRAYERMVSQSKRMMQQWRQRTEHAARLIYKHHPEEQLKRAEKDRSALFERLGRAFTHHKERKAAMLKQSISQLNAFSPLNIMERGYALTYSKEQQLVKSVKQVTPGDSLSIRLKDGTVDCQVWGIEEGEKNE